MTRRRSLTQTQAKLPRENQAQTKLLLPTPKRGSEMSHIVALEATNVKRLRAVSIKPNGSFVIVGGKNGAGKTSLLDSIMIALAGKDAMPAEPLRRGADKGQVEITLDDGLVIKRTFTPGGGGSLTVTSKDGARYTSPQKVLDGLVGTLTFDPLAFSRMDRKSQAQTLRDLVGLDFSKLDAERKTIFDARTDVNREVKRLEGALEKLPAAPTDTPEKEVSIDELAEELERRRAENGSRSSAARELESMRSRAVAIRQHIVELEQQIEQARKQLDEVTVSGKALADKVAAWEELDEASVVERMKSIQETNAAVRAAADRRRLQTELDAQTERAMDFTGQIQRIDDAKREKLEATKMPIEGLAFDESGVTLNGLPLDQASGAEKLRTSVAIGLAMHPKLKVLLVRDGSLLDENNMKLVAEMAEAAGGQLWLERVGDGGDCSVIIDDGMVLGAKTANGDREPGSEG